MASNNREERIAGLLNHYFESVWRKSEMGWDSDNAGEIRELAHLIIWEPPDPNAPQRGTGDCICQYSPEAREKQARRLQYKSWEDEDSERPGNLVAILDHRCPKHGEKAQPPLWGRHKTLELSVTCTQWKSLGIKYKEEESD